MKGRPNQPLQRQRRAERQQRGTQHGTDYQAYIQVRRGDFASRGRSHYVLSGLIDRHHDVLSELELHTLWALQLLDPVEIREGMPLMLEGIEPEFEWTESALGTVAIAIGLGLEHPRYSVNEPMRMTTDFLVTLKDGTHVAIHVKYEKDLEEERNEQLRAIEESYWRRRGVKFIVITEANINRVAVGNLAMFASFDKSDVREINEEWLYWLTLAARDTPMNLVLSASSAALGVSYSSLVNQVKYASLCGLLRLDLTQGVLEWTATWPPMRFGFVRSLEDHSKVISYE